MQTVVLPNVMTIWLDAAVENQMFLRPFHCLPVARNGLMHLSTLERFGMNGIANYRKTMFEITVMWANITYSTLIRCIFPIPTSKQFWILASLCDFSYHYPVLYPMSPIFRINQHP